jgi:acyl-CoA thioester hydrolase
MMPVKITYRVIYGDTDAMGIVYYANYLRLFEMGRSEWLRAIGVPYREIESWGVHAPTTQAYCHYLHPARYEDLLVVETDVEYLKRASIKFVYRISSQENGRDLAKGYTVHAFVDEKGRIVSTPQALKERIQRIMASGEFPPSSCQL